MNKQHTTYKTNFINNYSATPDERSKINPRFNRYSRYGFNRITSNSSSFNQRENQTENSLQSKELERKSIDIKKKQELSFKNTVTNNNLNKSSNSLENDTIFGINRINRGSRNYFNKEFLTTKNDSKNENNLNNSSCESYKENIKNNSFQNNQNKKQNDKKETSLKELLEIPKEENLGNEIKETVRCYICSQKITKPKMCPKCKHISCERCLYNWFLRDQNKFCKFCKEPMDFYKMISVPFMDTVIDFVEKVIYDNQKNNNDNNEKINNEIEIINNINNNNNDFCPSHPKEVLYYYCTNCNKAYCKVCFVFFGKEKDKHVGHNIVEYKNYKKFDFSEIENEKKKLNDNIEYIEKLIKRCNSYKETNEFERKIVNEFISNFQTEYNNKMDIIQKNLDNDIKNLKKIMENYKKSKSEVENFMKNKDKNTASINSIGKNILNKVAKINNMEFFSGKEVDMKFNISKNIYFNTFQSKVEVFNYENMMLCKTLKLENSKYEMLIDNKTKNFININLVIPKDQTQLSHWYKAIIVIRKKGNTAQSYELEDTREAKDFFYLKRSFFWQKTGESEFKIRAVLYDYYFE